MPDKSILSMVLSDQNCRTKTILLLVREGSKLRAVCFFSLFVCCARKTREAWCVERRISARAQGLMRSLKMTGWWEGARFLIIELAVCCWSLKPFPLSEVTAFHSGLRQIRPLKSFHLFRPHPTNPISVYRMQKFPYFRPMWIGRNQYLILTIQPKTVQNHILWGSLSILAPLHTPEIRKRCTAYQGRKNSPTRYKLQMYADLKGLNEYSLSTVLK